MKRSAEVGVIGAGIAGLQCARQLTAAGADVVVLEKSRRLGGRCATRHWEGAPIDHGAQYFTAADPVFAREVSRWLAVGVAAVWTRQLHRMAEGRLEPDLRRGLRDHYICPAGMSALGSWLGDGVRVERETRVERVVADADGWRIDVEAQSEPWRVKRLVATAPMPQLLSWFDPQEAEADWRKGLLTVGSKIEMGPCLALLVDAPTSRCEWKGVHLEDETLAWMALDSSKHPERPPGRFVLHATPTFSARWQDADPEEAGRRLLARAQFLTGEMLARPRATRLHRWRYARVLRAHPIGACEVEGAPHPFVLAGDAFHGGRVGGAWLSGLAAAQVLRGKTGPPLTPTAPVGHPPAPTPTPPRLG